ncbi:MAG: hypothetical protein AB8H03_18305 [Saprospiraceae bacterium]
MMSSLSFGIANIFDAVEDSTFRKSFTKMMKGKGIHSATISYNPFAFGKPTQGKIYRQFFYNEYGHVVKKFYFDINGTIDTKELYHFEKGLIKESKFIFPNEIWQEKYEYAKGKISNYTFSNPKWEIPKREEYEVDEHNRKSKKVSFGLMGHPELITEYIYDDSIGISDKYKYRYVTNPNGELIISILYTYDKKENQTGLFGFFLYPNVEKMEEAGIEIPCKDEPPKDIETLMKKNKLWVFESEYSSTWEYDKKNNQISFIRDEKIQGSIPSWYTNPEYGYSFQQNRVIISRSNSVFKDINGSSYLVKTVEWLPRLHEPMKAVKKYIYYDKEGEQIYPPKSKE